MISCFILTWQIYQRAYIWHVTKAIWFCCQSSLMDQRLQWLTLTYLLNIMSVRLREKQSTGLVWDVWAPTSAIPPSHCGLYLSNFFGSKGCDEKVADGGKIWRPIVRRANWLHTVAPFCLILHPSMDVCLSVLLLPSQVTVFMKHYSDICSPQRPEK